ncbi:hypothetical protein QFC22_003307 [Naganishia vaughanmartiniae]|uniref:Uncharacterized protein n=1 Tax=Naganishia vaughanmartiniae TaxID=1424756 RepID=A0ACC2X7K0_9TREE|nr:hypothetical protein QFC22_003307 [Naganishia vaughanmartiniae]
MPSIVSTHSVNGFPALQTFQSQTLIFSLNSTRIHIDNPDGDLTLLDFVRAQGFTGTKLGCAEGGCGACTVAVGQVLHDGKVRYRAVNACLMPLFGVHGCHVLTTEGIGSTSNPHPIQERFAPTAQCGFCFSGIVMAFWAFVRQRYGEDPSGAGLTEKLIEESFDGNLCRCTGYRPILDAAKSFARDYKQLPNVEILVDGALKKEQERVKEKLDRLERDDALAKKPEDDFIPIKEATAIGGGKGTQTNLLDADKQPGAPVLCAKGADCCKNKHTNGDTNGIEESKPKMIPGIPQFKFKAYSSDAEPLFPPYLKKVARQLRSQDLIFVHKRKDVLLQDEDGKTPLGNVWLRPGTLSSLLDVMKQYPHAKIRSGNTETGIEVKFKASRFAVSVFVSEHLETLATFQADDKGMTIGSALPLTDLVQSCKAEKAKGGNRGREMILDAVVDNLRHFAGTQIRNVATLAGNITTASPISDLNPVWVATGATLSYLDTTADGSESTAKSVNMRDFFLGYRKTALPPGAVVTELLVPFPSDDNASCRSFTKAYKQSKRKDDDIAIVTCCMHVELDGTTIKDIRLVYGGMAPITIESKDTQQYLIGKEWGQDEVLFNALERLSTIDFALPYGVPGGMAVYRKSLAMGFFAKFWTEVAQELQLDLKSDIADIQELNTNSIHRGVSTGSQDLEDVELARVAGQPLPHLAALKHVTGEAQYLDDIPKQANELYGALVLSAKPHAKILDIDPKVALEMEGVADFVSLADLPGSNIWNPPSMDEVFFAEDKVHTVGQIIGVMLAETKAQAQAAARAVKVTYEELPYLLTIDEAIEANSFFPPRPKLHRGDITKMEEESDHILEGTWRMGGQEQFYFETNAALVIPHKEDNETEVWTSTQNPSETQVFVASALGIPQNRVLVRTKRIGGGFGGKETRSINLAAVMAVAARKVKRPVRSMLDRDEDMITSGQRHPFMAKYRVGFTNEGKIIGLDAQIYNNGGWSQDLSQAVLERAMTHADGCYWIPNFRIEGKIAKTNTMSNSAFRGFGGPQGILFNECVMSMVAGKLGRPVEELRELNMYEEGDKTHFGQALQDWNVPTLWKQIKKSSDFDRRRTEVDAFNAQNRWKKRGLAMMPTKFGISFTALMLNQAYALVNVHQHDGSISLWHGGVEMGQGLHSKMSQVCADELGAPLEKIHIMETNTMTTVNTSATAASAASDLNGMAIKNACDQLNARLAPYREKMPNATFQELAHAAYFDRVHLSAVGHYKTPEIGFNWVTKEGKPFFYFTQGTAVSEVEIDTLTGDWTIVRADVHMDIGRSINPLIDVGQIEGAFTQGFGLTTMEETLFLQNGQLATRGPGAYKIPSFLDTPQDFRVSFLKMKHAKTAHLRTIQTSKGIGEPPLALGGTVYFAIKDALTSARKDNGLEGEWTLISPATPERIRCATGDKILEMAERNCQPKEGEKPFFVSIF